MRQMKDSGIAWVGEIPREWKMERLQWHLEEVNVGNNPIQTNRILSLTNKLGVVPYEDKGNQGNKAKENIFEYKLAYPNTIVANSMNILIGSVGLCNYFGCVSPVYYIFKAKRENNIKFLNYVFQTVGFQRELRKFANGILEIRLRVSAMDILKRFIPYPQMEGQQRIVAFLDKECEKIDGLKTDIQAQIDTLEQYKHSVITEAVTHGLNPDVPMKDSVVWFGKIPNSWTVVKGKYVFTQRNTRGNNIALQLLSPTQKYGVIPQEKYEELSGMSAVKLNDSTNFALLKTIHKGDYCISLRSFQGGFEYSEYEGVVSPAYQVFYPIVNVDKGYYKYLFKEKGFIEVMNSYTMSLRDGKNIAFDDFGNTFIPVPPVEEQKIIAEYLNKKCAEIEQTITDKKAQFETLDDYKKSLIYEYVTGKKEVA